MPTLHEHDAMLPLNRAGWLIGIVSILAIGFAMGWSCAVLRDPPGVTPQGGQASPGGSGRPTSAFGAVNANAAMTSAGPLSGEGGSASSASDAPVAVGAIGDSVRGALKLADSTDRLIRIREIFRTLSLEQLPDAFEQVKHLKASDRYQVLTALGSRWAELDPKGAVDFGRKMGRSYYNFLHGAMTKWAASSPTDAMSWVTSIPPSGDRDMMINATIGAVGRTDPLSALQIIREQGTNAHWAIDELFATWAERDPQSAAAAASELKGETNTSALRGVARAWAMENPQAAMAWGERIESSGARRNVMNAILDQWAQNDPSAVVAWSRNVKDTEMRRDALSIGIAQLAGKDLPSALSQIEALPVGEDRDQAVMSAAQSLGQQDARGAIQLLNQLEPGTERTQAIARMCEIWASSEPRAAVEWFLQNTTPSKEGYQLSNVLGRWVAKSPDEAIAWAQALPAGEKREAALSGMAVSMLSQEIDRAQNLFNQLSPDSQASSAANFALTLAYQDVQKARTWAETLTPGKAQAAAFGTVSYQLAARDMVGAAKWLETLPSGAGRDKAVIGFSSYASQRDPEGALAWALTMSDEADRSQQVESIINQWRSTDSVSARKWLETTRQLTPEQKRRIQDR